MCLDILYQKQQQQSVQIVKEHFTMIWFCKSGWVYTGQGDSCEDIVISIFVSVTRANTH